MASEPENLMCSSCGADVRPGTSFCYKCGETLAPADNMTPVPAEGGKAIVSNAWFKEDISSPEEGAPAESPGEFQETLTETEEISPKENEGNSEQASAAAVEDTSAEVDTAAEAEPEIKPVLVRAKEKPGARPASTAALRRKPKLQREKIEMVWEAPENSSNPMFIIGTIVIFVAVLLILLGVYLMK